MKRLAWLLTVATCTSLGGLAAAPVGEGQQAPYVGSKEFERMKQLVGEWEGTSNMGNTGSTVRVEYRLTAGGSAVVETLFPGMPEEMVSVYYDRQGILAMTHYCMLRNRPQLVVRKADADAISLEFSPGSDIDPSKDTHMHALTITFTDMEHISHKWTSFEGGKEKMVTVLTLKRVR